MTCKKLWRMSATQSVMRPLWMMGPKTPWKPSWEMASPACECSRPSRITVASLTWRGREQKRKAWSWWEADHLTYTLSLPSSSIWKQQPWGSHALGESGSGCNKQKAGWELTLGKVPDQPALTFGLKTRSDTCQMAPLQWPFQTK